MPKPRRQVRSREVLEWVIGELADGRDSDIGTRAARHFRITRQAAGRHVRNLVTDGLIIAEGLTKARRYKLAVITDEQRVFELSENFQEDIVWSQLRPLVADLPGNILDICDYGVTEILNNARDHSGSPTVSVRVQISAAQLWITIDDRGIGIFRKIKDAFGLDDERQAILELVKGRVTTDPQHHTGEGIFFTSRAFDEFAILSGSLSLLHRRAGEDWLIDDAEPSPGTYVSMTIHPRSSHTIREVFDRYATEQDDYAFRRTHLLVGLAQTSGGSLISRSQAKRIMARCERFREVGLDFQGVDSIGPAFADEIFRVWRRAHPEVKLEPHGMNADVEKMVRRALATGTPDGPPPTE